MAIPPGVLIPPKQQEPIEYGAYVSVAARSEFYGTELEVSTASSAASTGWRNYERRDASAGQQIWYRVVTPNDGVTRYVRARHWAPGFAAGAWFPSTTSTATVSFTPNKLPETLPPGAQVLFDGGGIRSTDIKPGKPGQSTTLTRTLRFPATIFQPVSTAHSFSYGIGTLIPNTTSGTQSYRGYFVLPKNVTVIDYRIVGTRSSTNDVLVSTLYRVNNAGTATSIVTLTAATTGTVDIASTGFSEQHSTANYFVGTLDLKATTSINAANLIFTELTYTRADYADAY